VKLRFDPESFCWQGIEPRPYKERGGFEGITRYVLGDQLPAAFALRYFELEPGGYSSLEKHAHIHLVIALRGVGKALVGDTVLDLQPFDALYVPPMTAHRWINEGTEPFGFLCPVDAERDRPQRLEDDELRALRSDPATAPYAA
jgi:S-methyl-1-thioxylulose 5-phosphate methylthiotransferase